MTVEGSLREPEFVRLNLWLFYRKPAILLLHLAVFGIGLYWSSRPGMEGARGALAWTPLVVPVILWFMVSHKSRLQFRKNRTLQATVRYTLEDGGILLETPSARARLPWSQVAGLDKAPRHLVIYGVKGQAFVVSKAWFDGPESLQGFLDAVEKGTAGGTPAGGP